MSLEIERKYLQVDFAVVREALKAQGAHNLGAHFESNDIFDTPSAELVAGSRLLRLRTQEWPGKTRYVLTLKLPAEQQGARFKAREEHELEVVHGLGMRSVLEGLGLRVTARYEKIREQWRWEDMEADLDVLPFMTAVELEGEAEHILRAAWRLGFGERQASIKNYHDLHQEWQRQNSMPPSLSFVFSEEQRRFWRQKLGLPEGVSHAAA